MMRTKSKTKIVTLAFRNNKQLTDISLPDSVTETELRAFAGCERLAGENGFVVVRGVLYSYHGEGGNIVIPDTGTGIEKNAFPGCEAVKSITIPKSVRKFGEFSISFA